MTSKQYSKPQLVKVGNAIEKTLGRRVALRDFRFRRLFF